MKCPFCGYSESKVVDSRPAEEGATIRRRRECLSCQKRFTTYEIMERLPLIVVKKDGSRQTFDKQKLINGMLRACEKRPVPTAEIQAVADEIEQELQNSLEREIMSSEVGEMVMEGIKNLDEVAFVRFASVYRQFRDINTFMDELNKLLQENTRTVHQADASKN
ncbi:MAG: transcriptional regulator NrdR [Oscillospiraceae bacterium]|nr:transcriptional regulator NrdR [Oscillospiraceae bacterium]